jgi:hypothetical protein
MKSLKYILAELRWIKVLFSPFKPFRIKCYVGKTRIGVPYFLPRKWVKATPERAKKAALDRILEEEKWNKNNPEYTREIRPFDDLYQEYMRYRFPVQLKVGFSWCGLGWKTKYESYRYETPPVFSFVFFGYQIALVVGHEHPNQYWESWLYYEYETKGTRRERVKQCREKAPQTWTIYKHGEEKETIDYYELILKKKYLR